MADPHPKYKFLAPAPPIDAARQIISRADVVAERSLVAVAATLKNIRNPRTNELMKFAWPAFPQIPAGSALVEAKNWLGQVIVAIEALRRDGGQQPVHLPPPPPPVPVPVPRQGVAHSMQNTMDATGRSVVGNVLGNAHKSPVFGFPSNAASNANHVSRPGALDDS